MSAKPIKAAQESTEFRTIRGESTPLSDDPPIPPNSPPGSIFIRTTPFRVSFAMCSPPQNHGDKGAKCNIGNNQFGWR
jgi:hypothetical protein